METDEILRAAQENADDIGEYEKSVSNKAILYSFMVIVGLCVFMIIFEWLVVKKIDFGKPALLLAIYSAIDIFEGSMRKQKTQLIKGIIVAVIALFFILLYVGALLI